MLKIKFYLIILSFFTGFSQAENKLSDFFKKESKVLTVDQAFQLTSEILDGEIIAKFEITKGYYLYKQSLSFYLDGGSLSDAYIPKGKRKNDEEFGEVEVYYKNLEISIPFKKQRATLIFTIEYQGCSESGFCYPPQKKSIELTTNTIAS